MSSFSRLKEKDLTIYKIGFWSSSLTAIFNQLNLKKWSADSKQIIVKGSGHAIHWAHPEVINNEILEIINVQ